MPSVQFKGKNIIWNHHQSPLVPTHTLDLNEDLSYNVKNANGNLIVEGDNLLALKALLPEYRGKVDCIYIDPPYNTGNEGWVYNDKVNSPMINEWIGQTVGKEAEDFTRHDKWLCMMTPRLKLLHEMLSDKGVIFVSIDDNEVHHLRMLMNEIWGDENFIAEFIWHSKYTTSNDAKYVSNQHEYILCFTKSKIDFNIGLLPRTELQDKDYKNPDNDPKGSWKATPLHAKSGSESNNYEIYFDNGKTWKPPKGRYPRYSESRLREIYNNGELYFNSKGGIDKKTYLSEVKQGLTVGSLWSYENVGHTHYNNEELAELFGKGFFENPKGTKLIKQILQIATSSNSIILDSFAGSGTTAQAVLELNKEDDGNRQFVLVQMPEEIKKETPAGIYCIENNLPLKISSITRERVRLSIEKKINPKIEDNNELEGLSENSKELGFEYYNLGTPLDNWSIISSQTNADLPSFEKLGGYIWKNLTGEKKEFQPSKEESLNKYVLGEFKGEKVILLYENDLAKLEDRELCMSLAIAKELEEIYPNSPKLVYSPTCYLDDWHKEKYQIRYINYPFGM